MDQFGQMGDIYDFSGQGKYILLELSASWCSPCNQLSAWMTHGDLEVTYQTWWKSSYFQLKPWIESGEIIFINVQYGDEYRDNASLASIQDWYSRYPHDLIPILAEKFKKNRKVYIYGNNFKTLDKTCIRDYIHIADIVEAFEKGIKYIKKNKKSEIINLGTKKGFSTLSIFRTFQKFYDYKFENPLFKDRRKGDVDKLICDNKKSYKTLKWKPKFSTLSNIIRDEKNWLSYITNKKISRKTIY